MGKQNPAVRGANPGASQLSHPSMKQFTNFIETRSSASSCMGCSANSSRLAGLRGLAQQWKGSWEDDGNDAGRLIFPIKALSILPLYFLYRAIATNWEEHLRLCGPTKDAPTYLLPVLFSMLFKSFHFTYTYPVPDLQRLRSEPFIFWLWNVCMCAQARACIFAWLSPAGCNV